MTFEAIWELLRRKQPKLENGASVVTIEAATLESLLRKVYIQGVNAGRDLGDRSRKLSDFFSGLGEL